VFHSNPKVALELISKQIKWAYLYLRLYQMYIKLRKDPRRFEYTDLALTPVTDEEIETREMFQSAVAQAYVGRIQRIERLRRSASA